METNLADLSCCSLSCRFVDGDLTRTSNDLRSTSDLRGTCINLFSRDFKSWTWCLGGCKRGRRERVDGCKGEGASASLLLFPFMDLAARNPRVSCSWGMENSWREREKRERDLGERVLLLGLIKPIHSTCIYKHRVKWPKPKTPLTNSMLENMSQKANR